MSDTIKALQRLNRRFGRERARLERWANNHDSSQSHRDRCWYEATQWSLAQGMVEEEIRKAKEKP